MTEHSPAPRWSRYVAIGDSFTEGLWDAPDGMEAPQRGWADLLASHLSERRKAVQNPEQSAPTFQYANLAIRGKLLRSILVDQVPVALSMQPDLVSLVGGGNDILRPTTDIDRMARNLEARVVRLREAGVDVLLGTGYDASGSPLVSATRSRVGIYNSLIWSMARRHGAYVLDTWGMRSLADWRMWSDDRIHLTSEGHARVAQAALVGLGLAPDNPAWDDPLTPLPPTPRLARARQDAEWVRVHVYPWATRRLRGRSSGDLLAPKRPQLSPLD